MCGHVAGKVVTVAITKYGQLSVASNILVPDISKIKYKVIRRIFLNLLIYNFFATIFTWGSLKNYVYSQGGQEMLKICS